MLFSLKQEAPASIGGGTFTSIQLYQPEKHEKTLLKNVLRQGFLFLFVVSMKLYGNMAEYLSNRFFYH